MEGYLLKWINPLYRWQKRYFILNNDILTYCEFKGGKAKGQISLKVAGIILCNDDPLKIILNTGTGEIILKAQNLQEKLAWVNQLRIVQEKKTEHGFGLMGEVLSDIWIVQAAFTESLSLMDQTPLTSRLLNLGEQLKALITKACMMLEDNRQQHQTVYESFDEDLRVQTEPLQQLTIRSITERHSIKDKHISTNVVFQKIHLNNEPRRYKLPYRQDPDEKFNIWPFLKDLIGKDLSRVPMPLIFHQPASALQMIGFTFEYFDSIKQACQSRTSGERMAHIMALSLSRFVQTLDQQKKPFNPILGETYEYQCPDYEIIAEQVSHHPPVSAYFVDGPLFQMWLSPDATVKFGGTAIRVKISGQVNVILKPFKEHYTYEIPEMLIKNLIFGEKYFEHVGEIHFVNHTTGDVGIMHLKERTWTGAEACNINAEIKDKLGNILHTLTGNYTDSVSMDHRLIWKRHKLDADRRFYYNYTDQNLQLNYLNRDILQRIPCTDSRLRPDIIALEHGWKELGQQEKVRIEEKQRALRKEMELKHQDHVPRFFELIFDPIQRTQTWKYKGNYEKDKHETLDLF